MGDLKGVGNRILKNFNRTRRGDIHNENHTRTLPGLSTPLKVLPSQEWLDKLAGLLDGQGRLETEFSIRLSQGRIEPSGRFTVWLDGNNSLDFVLMGKILRDFEASLSVLEAWQKEGSPLRQGIGFDLTGQNPEIRLYLHGRDEKTLAQTYHSYRWTMGQESRRSEYTFHFMPETPGGLRPLDLIGPDLLQAWSRLLDNRRFNELSGFWLRRGETGEIQQMDLAFPWHPLAGKLPGMKELLGVLNISNQTFKPWLDLPIRHLSVSVGSAVPKVSLYASAKVGPPFPRTEQNLRKVVTEASLKLHKAVDKELYRIPPPAHKIYGPDLGDFYDGSLEIWKKVLGGEMHYHAGLFTDLGNNGTDKEMEKALNRAVTELYPFIPAKGTLYDIGCGWGGPLEMIIRDLGCPSLGLTVSRGQFRHVSERGLPVRWGDAEKTLPPGNFDCVLLLESFSHIRDKSRLLETLRIFCGRLVMRVNCQDGSPPTSVFGDTMLMVSSKILRELIQDAGWHIIHWRNRRQEAIPSVGIWHRRFQSITPTKDRHLEVFRSWCDRVMGFPEEWALNNPLIEIVADWNN